MGRSIVFLAIALVATSCGGSTTTSSSSGGTTTTVATADDDTTTTAGEDDGRADLAAAVRALLDFIDEHGVAIPAQGAGTLTENGVFADDLGAGGIPELDFDIRVLQDDEGLIWFAVFGDFEQITSAWIEFDAVAEDGVTVVAETSLVGSGQGPPWVETAPAGSVIVLEVPDNPVDSLLGTGPTPAGFLIRGGNIAAGSEGFVRPGDTDGAVVAARISAWIYRATGEMPSMSQMSEIWAYSHFVFEFANTPAPASLEESLAVYARALAKAHLSAAELLVASLGPASIIIPIVLSGD